MLESNVACHVKMSINIRLGQTNSVPEIDPSCIHPPCTTTMIPTQSWSENSSVPENGDRFVVVNKFGTKEANFYRSYNVWTGINIAASLGGFFMLLIFTLVYKSKCNWKKRYPPCPSVEDEEQSQKEPWDQFINKMSGDSCPAISRKSTLSHNQSEKSLVESLAEWQDNKCVIHSYKSPINKNSHSVCTLPSKIPVCSAHRTGGSSHQLDLMVHRSSSIKRPARFAISFDEQAASMENWWQRVDINVVHSTPNDNNTDECPLDSIQTLRKDPKTYTDSPSVPEIPVDWSSQGSVSVNRRRSMFSRQTSVCIDDDMLPECIGTNKSDLVLETGNFSDSSTFEPSEHGNQRPTNLIPARSIHSNKFLTVTNPHTLRSPSTPRRSPNFLAPPPATFGPGRPTSPPPLPFSERTCIDLTSPGSSAQPVLSSCHCSSRRCGSLRSSLRRTPKLSQLQHSTSMESSKHWRSTDSMSRSVGGSVTKKRVNFSSFDASNFNEFKPNRPNMGSSISLKGFRFGSRDDSSRTKQHKIKKQESFSLHTIPIPSIEIFEPTSEPADNSTGSMI